MEMNELVVLSPDDLGFVDRMDEILSRRQQYAEVLREGLRQKMKHLQNDGEQAIDYMRHMIRGNADISEELKELEAFGQSAVLMAAMLRHEASKTE
jgi:hypothetical protein